MGPIEAQPRPNLVWRLVKFVLKAGLWVVVLILLGTLFCNLWVVGSTHDAVYSDAKGVVENEVGLVLGTSKKVAPTEENLHFKHRVEAAAALYQNGKVKHLLVSGANPDRYYNEPKDMEEALVKLGVPKSAITRDYAGLRTLDSVVRAKEIFGQEAVTIVSDDFHVPRAVFLARLNGLDAVGVSGKDVSFSQSSKSRFREWLARVKAVLDVYVLGTGPRHLGEPVEIRIDVADPKKGGDGTKGRLIPIEAEVDAGRVGSPLPATGGVSAGLWDRLGLHVGCPCHTQVEAL